MTPSSNRRPLSRQLMASLFVLMMVPVGGWYFLGDLTSQELWDSLTPADRAVLAQVQAGIRFKLALTLAATIVLLGTVMTYLRRNLLDPLETLADRARRVGTAAWSEPPPLQRDDEIGDLARALDRAVATLERHARDAESFALDLAHELRTPLAAIRGSSEILFEPDVAESDRRRFLMHVEAESRRLEQMVDKVLDLARLEARPADAHAREFPLAAFLTAFAERYRSLSLLPLHRLTVQVPDADLRIRVDPERLERVLLALLENGLRHTDFAGGVHLTGGELATGVAFVAVEDDGPGVPVEKRERVFERGFSTEPRGSGLGLPIARRLVEGMHQRIWLAEEKLAGGPGASFRFTLAMAPREKSRANSSWQDLRETS
jgi:signal transduction histidine kinase